MYTLGDDGFGGETIAANFPTKNDQNGGAPGGTYSATTDSGKDVILVAGSGGNGAWQLK